MSQALLDALQRDMTETFGLAQDPARWSCLVLLNVLVPRELPRELRMSPSSHETALVTFLSHCDVVNLRRMLPVEPDYVRAFAIYAFTPGGTDRLKAIAAGGAPPSEALVADAVAAYEVARLAGEDLDAKGGVAREHAAQVTAITNAALLVPKLAGALDAALATVRVLLAERRAQQ